jgi:inhibitor of KinA sporulation pathway (predicted exonuclease)
MQAPSIMLDLETLFTPEDLSPGQLGEVVEIAAVIFHPATGETLARFHAFPAPNGHITHATAHWWITQAAKTGTTPEWIRARQHDCTQPLAVLLHDLLQFIHHHNPRDYWSKGSFDYPILQAHLGAHKLHTPWLYYQTRDLRTVLKTFGPVPKATPTHNALEDCALQIRQLTTLTQTLRKAS